MMKKYFLLFIIVLCPGLIITSCGNDNSTEIYIVDENWQADNEKVIADISKNPEYQEIKSESNAGSIYYKVLEPKSNVVPSTDVIYYTSTVRVYYSGVSMDETSRKMEYVFDSRDYPLQDPVDFTVSGVVDGFSTALQHMHPGDRWEVWIPWRLGYGATGNISSGQSTRPWAYSTLKFEIEVIRIVN